MERMKGHEKPRKSIKMNRQTATPILFLEISFAAA